MTGGSKIKDIQRVTTMVVALPGWYTNSSWTTPVYVTLTWGYDNVSKSAGYGNGALYFTTSAQSKVYKQDEKATVYLPALRFERKDLTNFAKEKLAPYAGDYLVSDGTDEKIVIEEDGTVKLHTNNGTALTPLYYTVDNTNWREGDKAGSNVTSVVFSKADWFESANQKAPGAKRQTVTMTWDTVSKQFAVSSDVTCYKPESEEISRIYSTAIRYSTEESIKEVKAYMTQFVKGEYTLNDGSDWKIKVDETTGEISTKFDTEDYVTVVNPAPVFVQDTSHGKDSTSGEYGNNGKYLSSITVPIKDWYLDEGCTQAAVVTLTWKGAVKNPMDDHQFTVTATPLYRKIDGDTTECKYLAGTFYSDADRKLGEDFLKSLDIAGTYQPTAAVGKWWIVIDDDGKVTVHATDSQGEEHSITDVAMDLTMDKNNKDELGFSDITAVADIKVVIPQWRTEKTNNTLANIAKCAETSFTFVTVNNGFDNGSSYFAPSADAIQYANADGNGTPWEVQTKTSVPTYNKTLFTKIYKNDRAYSDDNKIKAKEYFAPYAGTYYIEDSSVDYKITITEEGEIYWGDYASGKAPLPADVQFDAIHDKNVDGKVNEDETEPVPGTISVWLNGYSTGTYTEKDKDTKATDGAQRADLTWNDTDEEDVMHSAHKFKTSGTVKGHLAGAKETITFELNKYLRHLWW